MFTVAPGILQPNSYIRHENNYFDELNKSFTAIFYLLYHNPVNTIIYTMHHKEEITELCM